MPNRRNLPPQLQNRPFDLRDLEGAGVRRGRARAGDLTHPYFGVHAKAAPESLLEHCHAYAVRMRPGQSFSHQTAAQLHGLPLPRRFEAATPLHVAAVRPASPPRTRDVVGERLSAAPVLLPVDGLVVCAPSQAWIQLAGVLTPDESIVIADHLLTVSPIDGAATRQLLERRITASRRRNAGALRAALAEARFPVLSPGETRVRLLLVRAGIPEPELNAPVFSAAGTYLGKPDLLWREQRVGLEYEGKPHLEDEQVLFDIERRERFEDHGWLVVRVSKHDLRSEQRRLALVERVRSRLELRSLPGRQ